MRVAILGTGYVGLVVGAGLAEVGHDVTCVDLDAARVAALGRGEIGIHERGLTALVRRNLDAGRLAFTTVTADAVGGAEVIALAVGTPQAEHGGTDLRAIEAAAREVGRALTGDTVIVIRSTVPIGTTERLRAIVAAEAAHPFAIAYNPEFLKEGAAVADFLRPDRIVIGVDASDARAAATLRALYAPLGVDPRVLVMDVRSAELTKYAANAMLAARVALVNELALLAEQVGADIERVREAVGADPRIGAAYLSPGPGFGGSCLPKDLRALAHTGRVHDLPLHVVEAAELANQRQIHVLGARVVAHFGGGLAGRRIAVWGLAFKPGTDDLRESPALALIDDLRAAGAVVIAYDPAAMANARAQLGDRIEYAASMYEAVERADALVLVTEWEELRSADLSRVKRVMAGDAIFDGRNLWDPAVLRALGFRGHALGRGAL
jgi:UDPglucose 6-dehydrogenase